jgi:very-short-patch-repair endonuclease
VSDRLSRAELRGLAHDGVLSRAELRAHGWDGDAVARQVSQDRWACHGRQTVALHTSDLGVEARRWRALFETGTRIALLDGATALLAAGLTGYDDDTVHVSVLHTASVTTLPGVRIHKVIRRVPGEQAPTGIPRSIPAVAAVRASHWAVSNWQAALLLVMPVQQRLVTGRQLVDAVEVVRGRTRRAFVRAVARDIADGAQSLGELDFAAMCRARGLPEPSRQVVRRFGARRAFLDVAWEDIGLVVEIDGSQHQWGVASTDDQFRQNSLVLRGDRVLRMTLMGLRLAPDQFMDQVCEAHRRLSSGWR